MSVVTETAEEFSLTVKEYIAFSALIVGTFLAVVDIQIVASSIGTLSAALGATIEEVAWVQSAYLTAEIIVIPLTAWLTKVFSTRNVVMVAVAGFTVTSAACASAWDLPSMVIFRILQGLFGGLMIPIMISSVYLIFPPGKQATAMAAVGFVMMFPSIIGPILGGWITEVFSWHWIFLINIPLGIGVMIAAHYTIHFDRPNHSLLKRIDIWGTVLIVVFLGSMEYVLKEGTKYDWFESQLIFQLTIVAVGSFVLLLWRELSVEHPVVDFRLWRNKYFALGCTLSFITGFLQFAPTFLLPAILSTIQGYNSYQIGNTMIVMGAFAALSGILAASLEKRIDLRLMAAIGFGLTAYGMWMDSDLTHDVGFNELFWGQAIRGLGMMLMFLPCSTVALGFLKEEDISNGSGFFNLMRNLGGAVGLSLITWLMQTRHDHHYHRLSEVVTEGRTAFDTITNEPAPDMQLETILPDQTISQTAVTEMATRLAEREALVMTYNDLWIFVAAVMASAFLLIPFMRKPDGGGAPVAAH